MPMTKAKLNSDYLSLSLSFLQEAITIWVSPLHFSNDIATERHGNCRYIIRHYFIYISQHAAHVALSFVSRYSSIAI